ncbi:MAG: hypothetical protein OEM64_07065 [Gammaproteobacteria bacterium]|nr:hypothetical protein [Gammaproteobacteria bacterium]MDH3416050.1 hypothetical protein [Gammaproteobacteria bacterium]
MVVNSSFKEQVRRNSVALISLFVAVSGLSYNTWRNERSEYNRNQRVSSFEVLLKLGELQQLVFHNHYDRDSENKGNPRTGWALVLTVQDLSTILVSPVPDSSKELVEVWGDHWSQLGDSQDSADAILSSIEKLRADTLALLGDLD